MTLESDFPPDIRVENEIFALIKAGHEVHIACFSHQKQFELPDNLPYTIHKTYIPPLVHKASVGALKFEIYFNPAAKLPVTQRFTLNSSNKPIYQPPH